MIFEVLRFEGLGINVMGEGGAGEEVAELMGWRGLDIWIMRMRRLES